MKKGQRYIDESITVTNCSKKGYYWIQDILFSDSPIYGTFSVFHESFTKGYKLGQPKSSPLFNPARIDKLRGFYAPNDIVSERLSNIFNPTLTPNNASEKGYVYIDDIIYNILNPNKDILDLITRDGYKLGMSAENDETSFFGFYMPRDISKKG